MRRREFIVALGSATAWPVQCARSSNRTAAWVASLSMGSRGRGTARTTGQSANPILFPRIPW
jgi:hypothetical protein